MSDAPVVFLAFSNDPDDYLKMIERERKAVALALARHADTGAIQIWKEESTSLTDLFATLNRYSGRVSIFHYGGHANGSALELVAEAGSATGNELAGAGGLAERLGQEANLQLVFLNGCATEGQVTALLENNVKAVIATSVPIQDKMATEFAEQFYDALGHRKTIREAFDAARAFVATRYGIEKQPQLRDLGSLDEAPAPSADPAQTWALYVHPQGKAALGWKLPETPTQQIVVRGSPGSPNPNLNTQLIAALLGALQAASEQFKTDLATAKDRDDFDDRDIPHMIIDAFPVPVGVQLRRLFGGDSVDVQRLRDLVLTYEIMVRMFCFAMLAQIWDLRIANPDLKISDEGRATLNGFMTLTAETAATFDYYQLVLAVVRIILDNGAAPFMSQCDALLTELTDDPSTRAHKFMEEMRGELRGQILAEEINSFCQQAEQHLSVILADLAFVVLYKPTTIKGVEVRKFRNGPIEYVHTQVPLDKLSADPRDSQRPYESYTDNCSVILQKSRKIGGDYINLTPFIIDQNALLGLPKFRLFFLSHYDAADDTYHYVLANDPDTTLVIGNDPQAPPAVLEVKAMFDKFKAAVLAA